MGRGGKRDVPRVGEAISELVSEPQKKAKMLLTELQRNLAPE